MTGFNLQRAIELERYAAAAYVRPNVVTPLAHWLVEDAGGYIVAAARGTKSLRDAFTDLECWPDHGIHSGFRAAYNQSYKLVIEAVNALPGKPLYLGAHSLGGAMVAEFCMENADRFEQAYTFGQPRIGDWAWKLEFNRIAGDRFYRIRNRQDIIPHLPLPPTFFHAGADCFIDWKLRLHVNPSRLRTIWSDCRGLWNAWRHFDECIVRDHYLASYEEALAGLAKEPEKVRK